MREIEIGPVELELDEEFFDSDYVSKELQNGSYEVEERMLIDRYSSDIAPYDVIELGGGIGVVATALDRITQKRHFVLEPDSRNVEMLKRTWEINDADYEVLPWAYEPGGDVAELKVSSEFWNSALTDHQYLEEIRTEEVTTMSIEVLREEFDIDDFVLVSDIEGAEEMLLEEREEMEDCQFAIVEFHEYEDQELVTSWFSETFEMEEVDREDSVVAYRRKDD